MENHRNPLERIEDRLLREGASREHRISNLRSKENADLQLLRNHPGKNIIQIKNPKPPMPKTKTKTKRKNKNVKVDQAFLENLSHSTERQKLSQWHIRNLSRKSHTVEIKEFDESKMIRLSPNMKLENTKQSEEKLYQSQNFEQQNTNLKTFNNTFSDTKSKLMKNISPGSSKSIKKVHFNENNQIEMSSQNNGKIVHELYPTINYQIQNITNLKGV